MSESTTNSLIFTGPTNLKFEIKFNGGPKVLLYTREDILRIHCDYEYMYMRPPQYRVLSECPINPIPCEIVKIYIVTFNHENVKYIVTCTKEKIENIKFSTAPILEREDTSEYIIPGHSPIPVRTYDYTLPYPETEPFNITNANISTRDQLRTLQQEVYTYYESTLLIRVSSARTGIRILKKRNYDAITFLQGMARKHYGGCIHCAFYSMYFYHKKYWCLSCAETDQDFEKLKNNFVKHMNRSHPNICKRKLMKRLNREEAIKGA